MKYGYTVVYVASVDATLDFYRRAFGFSTRFRHESGTYGELETGGTVLAFASAHMGASNLEIPFDPSLLEARVLGVELAFVTDDVSGAFDRAVAEGAQALRPAQEKPWGQSVAYVRAPEGTLVELCSPLG